jgi:hypothetical protein
MTTAAVSPTTLASGTQTTNLSAVAGSAVPAPTATETLWGTATKLWQRVLNLTSRVVALEGAGGASTAAILDWTPSSPVTVGALKRVLLQNSFVQIRSRAARTTNAVLDESELDNVNWEYIGQNVINGFSPGLIMAGVRFYASGVLARGGNLGGRNMPAYASWVQADLNNVIFETNDVGDWLSGNHYKYGQNVRDTSINRIFRLINTNDILNSTVRPSEDPVNFIGDDVFELGTMINSGRLGDVGPYAQRRQARTLSRAKYIRLFTALRVRMAVAGVNVGSTAVRVDPTLDVSLLKQGMRVESAAFPAGTFIVSLPGASSIVNGYTSIGLPFLFAAVGDANIAAVPTGREVRGSGANGAATTNAVAVSQQVISGASWKAGELKVYLPGTAVVAGQVVGRHISGSALGIPADARITGQTAGAVSASSNYDGTTLYPNSIAPVGAVQAGQLVSSSLLPGNIPAGTAVLSIGRAVLSPPAARNIAGVGVAVSGPALATAAVTAARTSVSGAGIVANATYASRTLSTAGTGPNVTINGAIMACQATPTLVGGANQWTVAGHQERFWLSDTGPLNILSTAYAVKILPEVTFAGATVDIGDPANPVVSIAATTMPRTIPGEMTATLCSVTGGFTNGRVTTAINGSSATCAVYSNGGGANNVGLPFNHGLSLIRGQRVYTAPQFAANTRLGPKVATQQSWVNGSGQSGSLLAFPPGLNLQPGQIVTGTGIVAGTYVTNYVNGSGSVALSASATIGAGVAINAGDVYSLTAAPVSNSGSTAVQFGSAWAIDPASLLVAAVAVGGAGAAGNVGQAAVMSALLGSTTSINDATPTNARLAPVISLSTNPTVTANNATMLIGEHINLTAAVTAPILNTTATVGGFIDFDAGGPTISAPTPGATLNVGGYVALDANGTGPASFPARPYTVGGADMTLSNVSSLNGDAVLDFHPWGFGNGTTTFDIPDEPTGRVELVGGTGAGLTQRNLGASGGEEAHLSTAAESGMPNHAHGVSDPGHSHTMNVQTATSNLSGNGGERYLHNGGGTLNNNLTLTYGTGSSTTNISISGSGAANAAAAHNNMQPFVVTIAGTHIYAGAAP